MSSRPPLGAALPASPCPPWARPVPAPGLGECASCHGGGGRRRYLHTALAALERLHCQLHGGRGAVHPGRREPQRPPAAGTARRCRKQREGRVRLPPRPRGRSVLVVPPRRRTGKTRADKSPAAAARGGAGGTGRAGSAPSGSRALGGGRAGSALALAASRPELRSQRLCLSGVHKRPRPAKLAPLPAGLLPPF